MEEKRKQNLTDEREAMIAEMARLARIGDQQSSVEARLGISTAPAITRYTATPVQGGGGRDVRGGGVAHAAPSSPGRAPTGSILDRVQRLERRLEHVGDTAARNEDSNAEVTTTPSSPDRTLHPPYLNNPPTVHLTPNPKPLNTPQPPNRKPHLHASNPNRNLTPNPLILPPRPPKPDLPLGPQPAA